MAVAAVLLVGTVLRSVQFGASTSMWWDEIAIALNVTERGWGELLFSPLMHYQVAPLGFLVLEKLGVLLLGDTEAGFRLFPFLLSLGALVLFWRVSLRYLRFPTMLAALIAFALSPTLVFYAGTVKQYSGDVAACLLLLWMTLRWLDDRPGMREALLLGVVGGVAVLLSHPAVLVAAGLGATLLAAARRLGIPLRRLLPMLAGWAIGAGMITYASLRTLSASTDQVMVGFWDAGFVPPPWEGLRELFWVPVRLVEVLVFFAAFLYSPNSAPEIAFAGVFGGLLVLGVIHLSRTDPRAAVVLAIPVAVAVAAACVRLLPLIERVSLFIGPPLLIASFAGFDRMRAWLPRSMERLVFLAALGFAALPGLALLIVAPPPRKRSESRAVLQEVRARRLPEDDLVVVRWWGWISTEYYGQRLGLADWTLIAPLEGYPMDQVLRDYLHQLDAFRGHSRVWVFLDRTWDCEEEAVLGYLGAIGRRRDVVEKRISGDERVSAHLYDLSDPGLLGRASAQEYPVPADCSE